MLVPSDTAWLCGRQAPCLSPQVQMVVNELYQFTPNPRAWHGARPERLWEAGMGVNLGVQHWNGSTFGHCPCGSILITQ